MNNSSINNIKIDLTRSIGSIIYDQNSKKNYLDFMGMYSTLALGYNNNDLLKFFKNTELNEYLLLNKLTNCEINSDILEDFQKNFISDMSLGVFSNFYFTSSGALAIEAAIKTAIRSTKKKNPIILTFKGSFHGIYGYGGILTDRFDAVKSRLDGFPGNYWQKLKPFYDFKSNILNSVTYEESIDSLEKFVKKFKDRIAAILVEPIQCTYGDHFLSKEYLKHLKIVSENLEIPLIFDEIQSGFYSTGEKWYFNHLEISPDILVFGKKAQLSGIMVNEKHSLVFEKASTLEATWDSNIIDMYRSSCILKILKEKNISNQISDYSNYFVSELLKHSEIKNIRHLGYIIAVDLESNNVRDNFVKTLKKNGLLCNPTRLKTVRFRPHLLSTKDDFENALLIIEKSLREQNRI